MIIIWQVISKKYTQKRFDCFFKQHAAVMEKNFYAGLAQLKIE